MQKTIKTLLLLALPASGKSEVRKYMSSLTPEQCREVFHIGPTVQLDDYPYVEFMREIDEVAEKILKLGTIFFQGHDRPFVDPYEWGTLIELLNEDYDDLVKQVEIEVDHSAHNLFQRIDAAQQRAGAKMKLCRLPEDVRKVMAVHLEQAAKKVNLTKQALCSKGLDDSNTTVIEFARGGAFGASLPLDPPFGYAYSVGKLSPQILQNASVLYVWVTPDESRRKNFERAVPPPGIDDTTLYHGVPLSVMLGNYGHDDMESLLSTSGHMDTIRIDAHGKTYLLPTARFDNRDDKTTFVRADQEKWSRESKKKIQDELEKSMSILSEKQS